MAARKKLLILPGDGVGPEVMREARRVVDWMIRHNRVSFDVTEDLVGGASIDQRGTPISPETVARARAADADYDEGGEAAIAAGADDPEASFVRVHETANPYLGELVSGVTVDDFAAFSEGEPHWMLAGAEKSAMLLEWEEEQARKARAPADGAREDGAREDGAREEERDV